MCELNNLNKILSKNIKDARLEKLMPKSLVSEGSNISYATFIKIEDGKKNITVMELAKLAKFMGIDISKLLEGII